MHSGTQEVDDGSIADPASVRTRGRFVIGEIGGTSRRTPIHQHGDDDEIVREHIAEQGDPIRRARADA
jgi:hypothetical protein